MIEWVLILNLSDRESLGAVRALSKLTVAIHREQLWLRGLPAGSALPIAIKQLPAIETYQMDVGYRLFHPSKPTPIGRLPGCAWEPVSTFIKPKLPTAALAGQSQSVHPLNIVDRHEVHEGRALLTDLKSWHHYAETAPRIRLSALRFAVRADQSVLVIGAPLPPLPGAEYWQRENLLIPAGHDFESSFVTSLVSRKLNPDGLYFLLFDRSGQWQPIPIDQVVPATRSAIRLTVESLHHG